ncbi:rhodanese-like domain-containing protein [Stenotrophobium rhamnosiphilum]|uniref:Sulfurtransferase n=1 Tax=Stenotrophobium rhamnosiphilum TaxID=2029166 RepID=A0A2T5MI15_9GAMM|nr:rhodanese-like domain-containing protein [Stenotrophobium rhamnosiphilum]PTU32221.1 sulfurtransferase [Stenotrophobium rhamnosiphilum]
MSAHSPGFMALINDAKTRIKEIQADEIPQLLTQNSAVKLIDTREESEYAAGHVSGAEWLGKGIIERDIEAKHPDRNEPLYLYCGGGFRSAIAADNLQKMGYTNVWSIDGGWRVLKDLLPTAK